MTSILLHAVRILAEVPEAPCVLGKSAGRKARVPGSC